MTLVAILFFIAFLLLLSFATLFLAVEAYVVIIGDLKGAPFVRSRKKRIETMILRADISPEKIAVDLGAGDGSIVIAAALAGAHAVGIEINPFLALWARFRIRRRGLANRARIIRGNLFSYPLNGADVVFLYLLPKILPRLKEKCERELKPGARIISNAFPIEGWTPVEVKDKVFVYHKP
ncbi:MAG: hypothetical protein G01um101433_800 [Parcubacteria group bacterium Gr01-1014_33]|nr:MAG: hypothetical protein G01um101433_800 [Parcubacteria group bacterium Gr01-1014_33]